MMGHMIYDNNTVVLEFDVIHLLLRNFFDMLLPEFSKCIIDYMIYDNIDKFKEYDVLEGANFEF